MAKNVLYGLKTCVHDKDLFSSGGMCYNAYRCGVSGARRPGKIRKGEWNMKKIISILAVLALILSLVPAAIAEAPPAAPAATTAETRTTA